jgi:hypothetical protein
MIALKRVIPKRPALSVEKSATRCMGLRTAAVPFDERRYHLSLDGRWLVGSVLLVEIRPGQEL